MSAAEEKKKGLLRWLIKTFVWVTAVFAPVKAAYTYISQGHLAWMHISTSRSLFSLLLYIFEFTGWAVFSLAFWGVILMLFVYLPFLLVLDWVIDKLGFKSDGLFGDFFYYGVAICLTVLDCITTFYLMLDMKKDLDKPVHISDLMGIDWALIVVGGMILTAVYLQLYTSVKDILKEESKPA